MPLILNSVQILSFVGVVVEKDDESYKIETYIVVVWLLLMMSGNWKRKNGNPTFELASEKEEFERISEGKGLWSESRRHQYKIMHHGVATENGKSDAIAQGIYIKILYNFEHINID